MALDFLPQPHRVTPGAGRFAVPRRGTIGISRRELLPAAEAAWAAFPRHDVAIAMPGAGDTLTIRLDAKRPPGGYRLKITPAGVLLEAQSPAAAIWGVRTLGQVAMQSPPGVLRCLTIADRPDFRDRGIYYDLARGRVPKPAHLAQMADLLGRYKINQLQLYVEHTFRFRGHPAIGRGASPLTAQDILSLDSRCRDSGVELVPSLASFGHMSRVLNLPPYRHLAEDFGEGRYAGPEAGALPGWRKRRGWSLAPANPETYEFLDSLYAEFLPLFSSGRFNVCCDETWDLGLGQSYAMCRRLGRGRLYLSHIRRLRRLAREYGKRIMFWGDIIRSSPELIPSIPRDAIVLDWGYDHNHDFAAIRDFRRAGREFYACPGTSSWVSLFPRMHEAAANIAGFAAAGKRNGASGLLTTDWGDGGHYNFMELSWHGYLLGAEQGWNARADRASFTRRFCKLFLNIDGAGFARAVDALGDVTHLRLGGFYQSIWQHVFFAAPGDPVFAGKEDAAWVSRRGRIARTRMRLSAKLGCRTVKRLGEIRDAIAGAAARPGADPHGVLPWWIFAIDTLRHAGLKLGVLGPGGKDTRGARRQLRRQMSVLRERFEDLWLRRNRRSEIRIALRRYDRAIKAL